MCNVPNTDFFPECQTKIVITIHEIYTIAGLKRLTKAWFPLAESILSGKSKPSQVSLFVNCKDNDNKTQKMSIDGQATVKKQRPVNLDLTTIALPASGKASILHRVTGVALFFALVFVIWAWAYSLQDQASFDFVKELLTSPLAKFIAWGTVTVLIFHLLAGVRHLIMDMGHWEELKSGNLSAQITIGLWIVLSVAAGVWLWF